MRTWQIRIDEDELRALIDHHIHMHGDDGVYSSETSSRIHDLTKRLNKKDEVEIEPVSNDSVNQQSTATGAWPTNG